MKRLFVLLTFLTVFFSCKEDKSPIPDYAVYVFVSPTYYPTFYYGIGEVLICPDHLRSTDKLGCQFGFAGVILFHASDNVFLAYDRACPVEAKRSVRVSVKNFTATCANCGAEYDLMTGNCKNAATTHRLKTYPVYNSMEGIRVQF